MVRSFAYRTFQLRRVHAGDGLLIPAGARIRHLRADADVLTDREAHDVLLRGQRKAVVDDGAAQLCALCQLQLDLLPRPQGRWLSAEAINRLLFLFRLFFLVGRLSRSFLGFFHLFGCGDAVLFVPAILDERLDEALVPMFILTQSIQLSHYLLPNFRGILLGLDWTGYQINLQKLKVPEEFSSKIVKRKGEKNGYFLQV